MGDSDALALALAVDARRKAGFSWDIYQEIEARYDFTDLSTMHTSMAASFDGTNYLRYVAANVRSTDSSGTLCGWFNVGATAASNTLFCSADEATANYYLKLTLLATGVIRIEQKDNDAVDQVDGTTTGLDDGAWHFVSLTSSGTAWTLRIDGASETLAAPGSGANNGDWFADTTNRDNLVFSALVLDAVSEQTTGSLDTWHLFSSPLTTAQADWVHSEKATWNDLNSSTATNNPGTTNLVGSWSKDEHSGVRMDSSGNDMHMVPGGSAKGVTFERTDSEYASVASAAVTVPTGSICGSFKTGHTDLNGIAVVGSAATNRIALYVDANGKLVARMSDAATSSASVSVATCDDDAWHFGGGVWNGNSYRLVYLDAVTGTANTSTRTPTGVYDATAVASYSPAAAVDTLDGTLDNLSIWDDVITEAEYNWLRTGGKTGGPATYYDVCHSNHADNPGTTNLKAWWQMNNAARTSDGPVTLVNVHNPGTLDLTTAGVAKGIDFEKDDTEYASAASAPATAPPLTIVGQFKPESIGVVHGLAVVYSSATNYANLYIDGANKLNAVCRNEAATIASAQSTDTVSAGTWYQCAVVLDETGGDAIDTYVYLDADTDVDGTDVTPTAAYTGFGLATGLAIGTNTADGIFDNWSVWSVKLSADEIGWLRTGGYGSQPATYWDVENSVNANNPGRTGFANLEAWYELTEANGAATLVDRHASHDLTTASGGAGPISATGLAVSYPDTDQTGLVVDLPTVVAGTVEETAEVEDLATEFDGVDQDATSNTVSVSAFPVCVTAWVRDPTAAAKNVFSINKDASNYLILTIAGGGNPTAVLREDANSITDAGVGVVTDGEWHLVGFRITSSEVECYRDGVGSGSPTAHSRSFPAGLNGTSISSRMGAGYLESEIDEVMVWGVELSDADFLELYNAGVGELARAFADGASPLTSTRRPVNGYPLSVNTAGGAGKDIIGTNHLILNNSPTSAPGIPAGQALGGLVSLVDDQSGNGNDLTQATLSQRPEVVRVADGTGVALAFNGVNNWMQSPIFTTVAQPTDLIVVSAWDTIVGRFVSGRDSSLRHMLYTAGGDDVMYAGSNVTGNATTTDLKQITARFNGASSKFYNDGGTAEASGDAGSQSMRGITIAADYNYTNPAHMTFRHYVLNDGAFTTAQLNAIGRKLALDHGLTWTAIA